MLGVLLPVAPVLVATACASVEGISLSAPVGLRLDYATERELEGGDGRTGGGNGPEVSYEAGDDPKRPPRPSEEDDLEPNQAQLDIAESAERLIGAQSLHVGDRTFNFDCTGVVLAAYYGADIDLLVEFLQHQGNGVRRLYRMAREHDVFSDDEIPQVGDLVFWDNTYDKAGNGRFDDELTHVGIVVDVDPGTGAIHYLHQHASRGIVVERMNLLEPDREYRHVDGERRVVNARMRLSEHRHVKPDQYLASHLFRGFGSLHEIEDLLDG